MNLGKTVFAQLMSFLPDYEFDKCVNKYKDNLYCKTESGLKGSTFIDGSLVETSDSGKNKDIKNFTYKAEEKE